MTGRRPQVVYWNNQPTPYVVARLNAVVDRGDVDLEVWFDELRQADRSWDVRPEEWRFPWRIVGKVRIFRSRIPVPFGELKSKRPDVFISNYDRLNCTIAAVLGRRYSRRLALRALPSYPAQSPPSWRQSMAWWLSFHIADGAKVPGYDGQAFSNRHGLPSQRTWKVTQSIDVDLYGSARHQRTEAPVLRFVVVSRMIRSKGIDELLAAWRLVRGHLPLSRLTLVGDGAELEHYRQNAADLIECEFIGFRQPEQLPEVYASADVLVFPTLGDPNGLVVEEAMAAGLPVISTDAAGDIRLRIPQDGGWIVPAGDVQALADALLQAARVPRNELRAMGERNAVRAKNFVVEIYARDFSRFVDGVLEDRRRCNPVTALAYLGSYVLAAVIRNRPRPRLQGFKLATARRKAKRPR